MNFTQQALLLANLKTALLALNTAVDDSPEQDEAVAALDVAWPAYKEMAVKRAAN